MTHVVLPVLRSRCLPCPSYVTSGQAQPNVHRVFSGRMYAFGGDTRQNNRCSGNKTHVRCRHSALFILSRSRNLSINARLHVRSACACVQMLTIYKCCNHIAIPCSSQLDCYSCPSDTVKHPTLHCFAVSNDQLYAPAWQKMIMLSLLGAKH